MRALAGAKSNDSIVPQLCRHSMRIPDWLRPHVAVCGTVRVTPAALRLPAHSLSYARLSNLTNMDSHKSSIGDNPNMVSTERAPAKGGQFRSGQVEIQYACALWFDQSKVKCTKNAKLLNFSCRCFNVKRNNALSGSWEIRNGILLNRHAINKLWYQKVMVNS